MDYCNLVALWFLVWLVTTECTGPLALWFLVWLVTTECTGPLLGDVPLTKLQSVVLVPMR